MRLVFATAFAALFATSALAAPVFGDPTTASTRGSFAGPAAPDPKDAQIAQLQARVAEDGAVIVALKRQREQCHDEEATALAQALLAQAQQQAQRAQPAAATPKK